MDSKNPVAVPPLEHADGNRAMLTMTYVTSGRFLVGASFGQLTKDELRDLSRTVPYHTEPKSARPLDAFTKTGAWCRVYDYPVSEDWHQLTFYNPDAQETDISVDLSSSLNQGGMALDKDKTYYVYDFWNDRLSDKLPGSGALKQRVRPGEARMMSVREVKNHPQYIATNRHIMQGMLDMKASSWDEDRKTLSGKSRLVKSDPYEIVVATNGLEPLEVKVLGDTSKGRVNARLQAYPEGSKESELGLIKCILEADRTGDVEWGISFKR